MTDKLGATASLGLQQNLRYTMGDVAGTSSIPGLQSFIVPMAGKSATLGMAGAGLTYALSRNNRLGLDVQWQQQASNHRGTTSLTANWTVGF